MHILCFQIQSFLQSKVKHTRSLLTKARVIIEMWGEEVGVYEL